MLLTCVLLRFYDSSYCENIKQYVVFIIKNSDMISWKWAHVKFEKGTTLGPGCQLRGGVTCPPEPPLLVGPAGGNWLFRWNCFSRGNFVHFCKLCDFHAGILVKFCHPKKGIFVTLHWYFLFQVVSLIWNQEKLTLK